MNKKISIIVPTYNNDGTISATIKSIQEQTFANIEIILVDDGSTDKTGKICDAFAEEDGRIKVIHQKNKGICGARNTGMDAATGDYLCFVDGDDEIESNYVEKLKSALSQTDAELIVGGITIYEMKKTYQLGPSISEQLLVNFSYDDWMTLYNDWTMIPAWNKLFSKNIIENHQIRWMEGLTCGEDGVFVFQYLKYCNKISIVRDSIYKYYALRGNSSTRFQPLYGQIKMFELKRELLKLRYEMDEEAITRYCAQKGLHNFRTRVMYLVKKNKPDFSELEECLAYYWEYFFPFLDKKEYYNEEIWTWLCENRKLIFNKNVRKLYGIAEKEYRPSIKRRLVRKIKRLVKQRD